MFDKVLIANRGEIALRIHRACREMGIRTVAVHSTADADAMHVRLADESVCIGPPAAADSYLNMPAIVSAAAITGADAIHPGVGFLSENAQFAEIVEAHGIAFIGPTPEHIARMGDKIIAKETMQKLGALRPWLRRPLRDGAHAAAMAREIGLPVLIKATAGGGGRGMQVVRAMDEVETAFALARREAKAAFGDDRVYMEKYLSRPRHIEIQILADGHGNVVHLGERDCSSSGAIKRCWRRAPSPGLNAQARADIGQRAVAAVRDMGYRGVGTLEFSEDDRFYFIEMNTRLQVEHPITEAITGVDLVRQQLQVAGRRLPLSQDEISFHGHAIECRINAEHPRSFMPTPGKIGDYHAPGGLGVRVDRRSTAATRCLRITTAWSPN